MHDRLSDPDRNDPALALVAAFRDANDNLEMAIARDQKGLLELVRRRNEGSHPDDTPVEVDASALCGRHRERDAALVALAVSEPCSVRGAIEMLTTVALCFGKPFLSGGQAMVVGEAAALEIIGRVRDAMERWEVVSPSL